MTRRHIPLSSPKRLCSYCDKPMGLALRYYLSGSMDSEIRGPYHAECANRMVEDSHKHHERLTQLIQPYDHFAQIAREETLPW